MAAGRWIVGVPRVNECACHSNGTQILCAHADDETNHQDFMATSKAELLHEMAEEIFQNKQKIILFASFKRTIHHLKSLFYEDFPQAFLNTITGDITDKEERLRIVNEFNAFEGPGCLILNPQAGGVGLNIIGANHVIHFDPEWNPALTEQANKRAHRIGQKLTVFINHFFYSGTIEEDIMDTAAWKRQLQEGVDAGMREE